MSDPFWRRGVRILKGTYMCTCDACANLEEATFISEGAEVLFTGECDGYVQLISHSSPEDVEAARFLESRGA